MSDKPPTNLYTALLAAQRAMGPVVKNATNPHLKSKYADLTSVLDAIEGPLWDNGLIVVQRFGHDEHGPILFTELIHAATGERIISSVPVVSKDPTDPQKMGGAITYYRRYSLLALLGLAPEDDDGHAASQPSRQTTPAPRAQTPHPPGPRAAAESKAAAASPLAAVEDALSDADFAQTPEGAMHYLEHAKTKEDADLWRAKCRQLGVEPREFGPVYNAATDRIKRATAPVPAGYAG